MTQGGHVISQIQDIQTNHGFPSDNPLQPPFCIYFLQDFTVFSLILLTLVYTIDLKAEKSIGPLWFILTYMCDTHNISCSRSITLLCIVFGRGSLGRETNRGSENGCTSEKLLIQEKILICVY